MEKLLDDTALVKDSELISQRIIERLGSVGCKTVLRLTARAVVMSDRLSGFDGDSSASKRQLVALEEILEDLAGDEATTSTLCNVL